MTLLEFIYLDIAYMLSDCYFSRVYNYATWEHSVFEDVTLLEFVYFDIAYMLNGSYRR